MASLYLIEVEVRLEERYPKFNANYLWEYLKEEDRKVELKALPSLNLRGIECTVVESSSYIVPFYATGLYLDVKNRQVVLEGLKSGRNLLIKDLAKDLPWVSMEEWEVSIDEWVFTGETRLEIGEGSNLRSYLHEGFELSKLIDEMGRVSFILASLRDVEIQFGTKYYMIRQLFEGVGKSWVLYKFYGTRDSWDVIFDKLGLLVNGSEFVRDYEIELSMKPELSLRECFLDWELLEQINDEIGGCV